MAICFEGLELSNGEPFIRNVYIEYNSLLSFLLLAPYFCGGSIISTLNRGVGYTWAYPENTDLAAAHARTVAASDTLNTSRAASLANGKLKLLACD